MEKDRLKESKDSYESLDRLVTRTIQLFWYWVFVLFFAIRLALKQLAAKATNTMLVEPETHAEARRLAADVVPPTQRYVQGVARREYGFEVRRAGEEGEC
jgi:hypothetical protein